MGSLCYHRHTICVSQGLTLSTASLVQYFKVHVQDVSTRTELILIDTITITNVSNHLETHQLLRTIACCVKVSINAAIETETPTMIPDGLQIS